MSGTYIPEANLTPKADKFMKIEEPNKKMSNPIMKHLIKFLAVKLKS